MHFPKFTLLLNEFKEPVGASSYGSHTVYSFFVLFTYFQLKVRLLLLSRKGVSLIYLKRLMQLNFLHSFRLIAGHMPKPVKLGDVLQYMLSGGESEVEMGCLLGNSLNQPIEQENYRFWPCLFLLAECAPSCHQQSGSLLEKIS